jgi:hypothetical protein
MLSGLGIVFRLTYAAILHAIPALLANNASLINPSITCGSRHSPASSTAIAALTTISKAHRYGFMLFLFNRFLQYRK